MTELELHAFRQLSPLQAAEQLWNYPAADLRDICRRLGVKVAKGDFPEGLRQKILAVTHPAPARPAPAPAAVQLDLFGEGGK